MPVADDQRRLLLGTCRGAWASALRVNSVAMAPHAAQPPRRFLREIAMAAPPWRLGRLHPPRRAGQSSARTPEAVAGTGAAILRAMRCEDVASHPDFRHLPSLPGLAVDLRYASANNFVGRDLYGSLDCAWLHQLAADGLERAVALLAREAPGHRLLVLDALRPHRVQVQLWDFLEGTDLRQYVADPALGSIHSFGMALDATLLDPQGRELDMGTGYDEMVELSHPTLEARLLASGALAPRQHRNRELLRGVLLHSGFRGIDNEWWHFEMLDRGHVRQTFTRVD